MKIGFDKVYCISYCRNIEKQNNIRKLMKYLGINFEFIYGADYTNLNILKHKDFYFNGSNKNVKDFKYYTHFIGASYDHYTAVIHAYESGANSVLIMEDDCAFINDISYIQWALNNYPKDADIIKFGYFYINFFKNIENIDKYLLDKKYFLHYTNHNDFPGSQLYGLCNRETMRKYINWQQNKFECVDLVPASISNKNYGLIKPLALDKWMFKNSNIMYYINKYFKKNNYTLLEHI